MNSAYAAGFFDGDGTVGVRYNNRSSMLVRVAVTQNKRAILDALQREFGGKVFERKEGGRYEWRLTRKTETKNFLETIFPYARGKLSQVAMALNLLAFPTFQRAGVPPVWKELRRRYIEAIAAAKK